MSRPLTALLRNNVIKLRQICTTPNAHPSPSTQSRILIGPPTHHRPLFDVSRRWKGKSKQKSKSAPQPSRDQVSREVLDFIREEEMMQSFERILTRFHSAMQTRLALRLSPQVFAEIHVAEAHTKLGQIANFMLSANTAAGGDQTLLVDLTGHPEFVSAARKAINTFLDSTKGGTGGGQIQSAGPTAFSIRLRTVVTRETREELVQRGHDLFNQIKREMDQIYQTHDKLIHSANPTVKKQFSEDHLFLTREYLRGIVRKQHDLAASMWDQKQQELKTG